MIDQAHPARLPDPMTPSTPAAAIREALLEHQVETLTGELERLKAEVERVHQERTVLRLKIDAMARRLFGKSFPESGSRLKKAVNSPLVQYATQRK